MPEIVPPESLSCKSSDLIHSDSASTQRGRVMSFISERGSVTLQELIQQFGKPYLDAALEGLFDRCQIDFSNNGGYFVSPEDQWRRSTPSGFRYGSRRSRKPAYSPLAAAVRLFHHFRKQSIDPSKSEAERSVARNAMMDVYSVLPWGLASDILDWKE
jgi:hypothetical protein